MKQKELKNTIIVTSNYDFSKISSICLISVEFKKMEPRLDLFGTGFHIEITGPRLKDELETMFKISSRLKEYLKNGV